MKVLIATDGSDASRRIIETACGLITNPENTAVKIISAVEPYAPMGAEPFAVSAAYYAELEGAGRGQAKISVEQAATNLKELCPRLSDVSSKVLRGTSAAQAIVETAREWSADLIIVGSHGYGFWSRALLGSVSNSVVHHAPCSVLIVRQKNNAKS